MLNPVAAAIVATAFPDPGRRARALGVFSSMTGLSQAVGPIIGGLGLLAATVLALVGLVGYEPRRVDPLLDLRLFRSTPFSAAILISLFGMCGFGAFLFVTTQYLQTVRGLSPLVAGLSLLPVGISVAIVSPLTGRLIAARGPRLPLAISGAALAAGGGASMGLGPVTPRPIVLATFVLFGVFLGTVIAPITTTALSGMPRSMAALATSLPSAARQTGTALGVAISGTIVASALPRGGTAFTNAEHIVWWLTVALGVAILILALASISRRAAHSADRAAALFDELDRAASSEHRVMNTRRRGMS